MLQTFDSNGCYNKHTQEETGNDEGTLCHYSYVNRSTDEKVQKQIMKITHLARQLANCDSGTCGPQRGRRPLHLVLAFCNAALSHSSRPLACLYGSITCTASVLSSRVAKFAHNYPFLEILM